MERYELPDGWVWTTLGKTCEVNPGMSWPKEFVRETPVSFVPMAAVDDVTGAIAGAGPRPIGEVWRGYKRFFDGDVIFARITPCIENGKAAIASGLLNGIGLGSTEFHVLRPASAVAAKWLYYFVRQVAFRNDAARAMTGTAGQLRVPASFMAEAAIPLPPLPEQQRIVARIEALFEKSRAAREALAHVPALVKRFRQSVLGAAFRGDLTARDPDDEPASALLERIRGQRGEMPDVSGLPELPEGWLWVTTAMLRANELFSFTDGPFGSNLKTSDYVTKGVSIRHNLSSDRACQALRWSLFDAVGLLA